jgi:hypothetical protein
MNENAPYFPGSKTPVSDPRFLFFIETQDGKKVEWRDLTKTKARQMYSYTDKSQPSNVARYGWEEVK